MKNFIWAVFAVFGIMLTGCKTTRTGEKENLSGKSAVVRSEKAAFAGCLKNNVDYTTYSAKTTIVLNASTGTLRSKATVRIVRDKVIQISIQPVLGIEMFRLQLTNDSIWIVDKPNSRYVAESIAAYKSKLPVDLSLSTIQSLFLGRPFLPGKTVLTDSDYQYFSWNKEKSDWLFAIKDIQAFSCRFVLDELMRLRETQASDISGRMQINWSYTDFQNQSGFWFPAKMKIRTSGVGSKNLELAIEDITPEWDKAFNVNFAVSSRYKKVSVQDLINMFLR